MPAAVLVGPTASGKTEVVCRLARKFSLEAVSCDSMQAYRGMRILSQAPDAAARRRAHHHLIGFLDPRREYSAADFARRAEALMRRITSAGKVPLVVGGTGLYVSALLDGLFPGPAKDESMRERLMKEAELNGTPLLHARLAELDADAAKTIHINDLRRIVRALEVIELTGEKFSAAKKRSQGLWGRAPLRLYGLHLERDALYARIDARVEEMFDEGLVAEVKKLPARKLSMTASMCLGVREVLSFLEGRATLKEAKEQLKQNTRRYAKRQIAWFKRDPRIRWISAGAGSEAAADMITSDLRKNDGKSTARHS